MRVFMRISKRLRGFADEQRGTQMVELAIVLPVLCLMVATAAEFGRFFHTYTTLTKATRSAARFLTTAPANGTDDAKARNLVVYGDTTGDGDPVLHGLSTTQVKITRTGGVLSAAVGQRK